MAALNGQKEQALKLLDKLKDMIEVHEFESMEIVFNWSNNVQPARRNPSDFEPTGEMEMVITINIRDEKRYAEFIKRASIYGGIR